MPSLVSGNNSSTAAASKVRSGMAIDLERRRVFGGQDLDGGVLSIGRVRSDNSPLTLATMAASARRGLIACAISMGRLPASTAFDCRREG